MFSFKAKPLVELQLHLWRLQDKTLLKVKHQGCFCTLYWSHEGHSVEVKHSASSVYLQRVLVAVVFPYANRETL